jgi:hypothetical protein
MAERFGSPINVCALEQTAGTAETASAARTINFGILNQKLAKTPVSKACTLQLLAVAPAVLQAKLGTELSA